MHWQVWVFNLKEGPPLSRGPLDAFLSALRGQSRPGCERTVFTDIFKFINAGAGVARVKLHADGKRMAVLLPLNQTVEVIMSSLFALSTRQII